MSEKFPQPTRRDEVLANIRKARAEREASFSGLSEQQLEGPVTDVGWTVKDHLSHIAEWRPRALAVFDGKHPGKGFRIDQDQFERLANVHELNALLFQRNRDRTLSDVIEDFRETHRAVESRIEQMTDADLQREPSGKIAARFPRVLDLVKFNLARHDRVHIKDIRALAGQPVS